MFDAAGVQYRYCQLTQAHFIIFIYCNCIKSFGNFIFLSRQYTPKNQKIEINFSDIDWSEMNQLPQTPPKQD